MFKLSTRKLQKLNASLYVCLPVEWTRNHNLERRSKVTMSIDQNNALIITPEVQNGTTTQA